MKIDPFYQSAIMQSVAEAHVHEDILNKRTFEYLVQIFMSNLFFPGFVVIPSCAYPGFKGISFMNSHASCLSVF